MSAPRDIWAEMEKQQGVNNVVRNGPINLHSGPGTAMNPGIPYKARDGGIFHVIADCSFSNPAIRNAFLYELDEKRSGGEAVKMNGHQSATSTKRRQRASTPTMIAFT